MDDLLTNPPAALSLGVVVLLFGGFLAIYPHRFLHPFKGKLASAHSEGAMTFMRIAGGIVALGGARVILASVWVLMGHPPQQQ